MRRLTPGSCFDSADEDFADWKALLRHYDRVCAPHVRDELSWHAGQPSLAAAIALAAKAINASGHRYDHQRRIPRGAIVHATKALLAAEHHLAAAGSFHELLEIVEQAVRPIFRIGPLYCYDTAIRIGAFRRLFPDRVYLHAGTRYGAKAIGLNRRGWIRQQDLPQALRAREPHDIENILCIYAAEIAGWTRR